MTITTTLQRCTRCGMPPDALIHHATANGHDFTDAVDVFAAIDAAYAAARAAHDAGTCGDSEWSCSYCEASR